MDRTFSGLGALAGFLAVAFGAFGAHALKDHLKPEMLAVYQTGVQYQMAHALALLIVGLMAGASGSPRPMRAAGWLFVVGIVIFSGSLYALALSGVKAFGAVTPLGGLCFLSGWLALAWSALRRPARP